MKLFERLSNLLRSNLNAAIDKVSDPGKEIDLLVEQMEEELRLMRTELRDAMVEEKLWLKRAEERYRNVQRWREHAVRAVQAGDDDLAKEALRKVAEVETQQEEAEEALSKHGQRVESLRDRLREGDKKLAHIKSRKETLKARAQSAKRAMAPEGDAFSRFDQLVADIETNEERAQAMADIAADPSLNASGKLKEDTELERKFQRLLPGNAKGSDASIEARLLALKSKINTEGTSD